MCEYPALNYLWAASCHSLRPLRLSGDDRLKLWELPPLQGAIKGLSGGEKSFATLSFTMALQSVINTPFCCLDEFDVVRPTPPPTPPGPAAAARAMDSERLVPRFRDVSGCAVYVCVSGVSTLW